MILSSVADLMVLFISREQQLKITEQQFSFYFDHVFDREKKMVSFKKA